MTSAAWSISSRVTTSGGAEASPAPAGGADTPPPPPLPDNRRRRSGGAAGADELPPRPRLRERALRQVRVRGERVGVERARAQRVDARGDVAAEVTALERPQRSGDPALDLHAALEEVPAPHEVEVRHRRR